MSYAFLFFRRLITGEYQGNWIIYSLTTAGKPLVR